MVEVPQATEVDNRMAAPRSDCVEAKIDRVEFTVLSDRYLFDSDFPVLSLSADDDLPYQVATLVFVSYLGS